jgi:hypothetical protein
MPFAGHDGELTAQLGSGKGCKSPAVFAFHDTENVGVRVGENAFSVRKTHLFYASLVAKNANRAVNRGAGDTWNKPLCHVEKLLSREGALNLLHCVDHSLFSLCISPFYHPVL